MAINVQRVISTEIKNFQDPVSSLSLRSFSKDQEALFLIITQLAIHIFFALGVAFMAASVPALAYKSIVIPILGISASAFYALFLQLKESSRKTNAHRVDLQKDFFHLLQISRTPLIPADAPRGVYRKSGSMNCAFNSLVHFLESEPPIADWLRHTIPKESDLINLEARLAPYRPPHGLQAGFRSYVEKENTSPDQLPEALGRYMETFRPAQEEERDFRQFRETYRNLIAVLPTFREFLALYDEAIGEGSAITRGDSQALRMALSRAGVANPSHLVQEDAAQILGYLLAYGPDHFKTRFERVIEIDTTGLPPLPDYPDNRSSREELDWGFILNLPEDSSPDISALFANLCEGKINSPNVEFSRTIEGQVHSYKVTRMGIRLLEAPAALRFHLNRVVYQSLPEASDASENSTKVDCESHKLDTPVASENSTKVDCESHKLNTPVQIPRLLSVSVNGVDHTYRLAATINHLGSSAKSGHYVAVRIVNDKVYLIDDSKVSQLGPTEAEEAISQACLVSYIHT